MGFDQFTQTEDEDDNQSEDGDGKVAYIYVRSEENRDAYDLMSTGLGGDARLRNFLKDTLNDEFAENQHDFFQQLIVALEDLPEGDLTGLLEFFHVDDKDIARYLDQNEEVREEFMERVRTTESAEADD